MNGNKEELLKFQEAFRIEQARKDSIRAAQPIVLPGDDKPSYGSFTSFSDMPDIPGLIPGGFAEQIVHGSLFAAEAEQARAQGTIEAGKAAYEALQPIAAEVKSATGEMLTGDYQRSVVASVAGAPVDLANSLLTLLGIEMSSKPFMGSRHIKESLDYLSDTPYSTKFREYPYTGPVQLMKR